MKITCLIPALTLVLVILTGKPGSATSVIPSDPGSTISLDGNWRFRIEQPGDFTRPGHVGGPPRKIITPVDPISFQTPDYKEDADWKDIKVPANWEMEGFSPATYNQPDNAIGLYRLKFHVPAEWQGQVVKLNFDGVQNGAEVFVNGKPVNVDEPSWGRANYHEGGWDAFQADVTPAVKFGAENLLAIRVTKNTKSVDLDTGDFFFLGGIHRAVTLFSVPKTHIEDLTVETNLMPEGRARVRVTVALDSQTSRIRGIMRLQGQKPVDAITGDGDKIVFNELLDSPRLWSAEHPELYGLGIDLLDSEGHTIEHVDKKIGVREVSIRDGVLLVNNVPVKLTGMCRHDIYPTLGTALNEKIWRQDIMLMKAANVNAIRTSHYPYGSGFYDLCDEMGMYVMDEMAACWCPTDRADLAPAFAQHARELVRRDKNHPSVITWAIGNENKKGENNRVAAYEIGKLDKTRPRLVSWRNGDEYGVEFDDAHYTKPQAIARANGEPRRKTYPKIYLENPNDWEIRNGADYGDTDRWAAVIDRVWQEVWKDDHVAGSFLWEWQDRAVADKCTTKLYDFDTTTGINYVKAKGICDGFRNPRPWYYHVKMAYAPIKLDLSPQVNGNTISLAVTNDFSFTDLADITTTWGLRNGKEEVASGSLHANLAPGTHGLVKLELPPGKLQSADALTITFTHPHGNEIATYQLRLKPEVDDSPKLDVRNGNGILFPKFNLVTVGNGTNSIGWRTAVRHAATLTNIRVRMASDADLATSQPVSGEDALAAMPLANVRSMIAMVIMPDQSTTQPVAQVRTYFDKGQFRYVVDWASKKADCQELGWIFSMPGENDHFSWHRKAYWSWYPSDHIGRPIGTATPDSANEDLTHLDRPDAFDFNSTKYDCNWATLADAKGNGIGVNFKTTDRYQCRAGNAANGNHVLIVNKYCSVPQDLSTNIVPDYTFSLCPGKETAGEFAVGKVGSR